MRLGRYSHFKVGIALGTVAVLALILCVQCVRTYWYTDAVLVPQQAQREADRQAVALGTAARSAGVTDPRALGPGVEHAMKPVSDQILWMRVLDTSGTLFAQVAKPGKPVEVPADWREQLETH